MFDDNGDLGNRSNLDRRRSSRHREQDSQKENGDRSDGKDKPK
jgi:hypothetical protein